MVPFFNKSGQANFLIIMDNIKVMQLRKIFGSLLTDGTLRTRRGGAGAGTASAAVFHASNITNYMLVLCASFQHNCGTANSDRGRALRSYPESSQPSGCD